MLDPNLIRQESDKVKKAVTSRNSDPKLIDLWLDADQKKKELRVQIDKLRSERNTLSDLFKSKKPDESQSANAKKVREQIQELEKELSQVEDAWKDLLWQIPNMPAEDVPLGKDEKDNQELEKHGKVTDFEFNPKDHLEIGEKLGILDTDRAAKVSGPRFGYFIGDGALLEFGLMWHVFKKLVEKGFTATIPPAIIKKEVERGLGYAEAGGWDQEYVFEKDEMVFISSSEHSVIPLYKDETIQKNRLPMKFVNFSPCFRREAGSYGKDTKGFFRVHQFNKVEMNVYTLPDYKISDKECLNLRGIQEEIVRELDLPYRIVAACSGDLPFPNRRMYDLEVWFPGQKRYRETHSCSNCGDYQTRRLNIKVATENGNAFAHALNATAVTDRLVLAVLENYQQKDGSVLVPKALQEYLGKDKIQNSQ